MLLEDIQDKVQYIAEGRVVLNNKIDNLTNELHTGLQSNRDELIFLIKSSIEHSEERLTKKIEDGDRAVVEQLTKKIDETNKRIDGTNARLDETNKKIDGIKDILKVHADKLDTHEERISHIERKVDAENIRVFASTYLIGCPTIPKIVKLSCCTCFSI